MTHLTRAAIRLWWTYGRRHGHPARGRSAGSDRGHGARRARRSSVGESLSRSFGRSRKAATRRDRPAPRKAARCDTTVRPRQCCRGCARGARGVAATDPEGTGPFTRLYQPWGTPEGRRYPPQVLGHMTGDKRSSFLSDPRSETKVEGSPRFEMRRSGSCRGRSLAGGSGSRDTPLSSLWSSRLLFSWCWCFT